MKIIVHNKIPITTVMIAYYDNIKSNKKNGRHRELMIK